MKVRLHAGAAVLPDPGAPEHGPLRVAQAAVDIEGGRIVAVHEGGAPTDPGLRHVHLPATHFLTPAFIDSHTHLALIGLRGLAPEAAAGNVVEDLYFRVESALTREDVRALARVGAMEAALSGTALVWDHYYFADAVAEALDDVGLVGCLAPTLQDLAGPGRDGSEAALAATHALRSHPRHAAVLGPHATDTVSDALWRRIADLAEAWELPVHVHVAQAPEEVRRAAARGGHAPGTTPVGLLSALGVLDAGPRWLLVHLLHAGVPELAAALAPRGGRVIPVACPDAWDVVGVPADLAAWHEAGLRFVVGTDAASANDSHDLPRTLRAVARDRIQAAAHSAAARASRSSGAAPDADRAFAQRTEAWRSAAALGDPARLLHRAWTWPGAHHPAFRAGILAPGARALLAVWDTDHPALWPGDDPLRGMVFGRPAPALRDLWVDDRFLGDGSLAALAAGETWRAWRAEARARRTALLARAGLTS